MPTCACAEGYAGAGVAQQQQRHHSARRSAASSEYACGPGAYGWSPGSPRLAPARSRGDGGVGQGTLDTSVGAVGRPARHPIRTQLIVNHWDDLLRLAGSLSTGTVQAESLIRTLQRGDRPTKLGRALQELGRVIKTLFVLNYLGYGNNSCKNGPQGLHAREVQARQAWTLVETGFVAGSERLTCQKLRLLSHTGA